MGNTESNESNTALIKKKKNKSNAAGSSEEYSARRQRENTATVVRAATAVAAVAAAGWAVTKLLSSSASEEDEKTNDKGKSMAAVGTFSGYRIPRNRFEDSPYDYFPDVKTNERQKMMVAESYQIPSNEFEDSHSDSEDEETDEECPYPYIKEGLTRRDQQISGKPICWRFPGYRKLKLNSDGSVKRLIKNKDGSVRYYINPPRAGFGGVIRDERGSLILGFYGRLKDGCEVLEAKLWGIHKGLEIIRGRNLREVEIESDSKSAIRLIKDDTIYMKSPFKELVEKCKAMTQETGCMLKHTLREGNRVADKLAKRGRDQYDNFFTFSTPPNKSILHSLAKDVASASYY